jgi:DNA-binding MarR family transcriptional regulator
MNAGAMTRMLDRLAEKGLIERSRCPDDRRATRIALTPSGKLAVDPINEVLADTLNDALRGFDRDEYATLVGLLKRVLANTRTMPIYGPPARDESRRAAPPAGSPARR